ncbi:MAG: DUF1385 domain-containing protein [Clostridia bacterium]|nr:DUF1385 domain-containing protein [Clostridia bacterium]
MSKKDKNISCAIKTSIGGQALMEGIMMRGPKRTAMAVRNTKGEIVLEEWDTETKKRAKFFKLPFVRGVFNFADSMKTGYKCLMRSAEISGLEELEEEIAREKAEKKRAKAEKKAAKKGIVLEEEPTEPIKETVEPSVEPVVETEPTAEAEPIAEETVTEQPAEEKKAEPAKEEKKSALVGGVMILGVVLGVALAILLFFFAPTWISTLILGKNAATEHPILVAVLSGVIKVVLLVGYMSLVLLMKEIRRTFMYHGAEHKTIFCYEKGEELTVENVRKQRRFHPRCGTSFLILMLLVSIAIMIPIGYLLSSVLPSFILSNKLLYTLIRTGCSIVLIPVMMGVGYELIKFAGRHENLLTRIISAPGVWLQHITTQEPDDDMIECAIEAMKRVIPSDDSDRL